MFNKKARRDATTPACLLYKGGGGAAASWRAAALMGDRLRFFSPEPLRIPRTPLNAGSGSIGAGPQPVEMGDAGRSSAVFMAPSHEHPREAIVCVGEARYRSDATLLVLPKTKQLNSMHV